MAKLLMSIFAPSEKRKGLRYEGDEGEDKNDFTPPMDDRRKLSISRSGRMRQANKKRHLLALEVYGETNISFEKPKSVEYHVNNPAKPINSDSKSPRRHSGDPETIAKMSEETKTIRKEEETNNNQNEGSADVKTPEEEIDRAFEIIDKVS